MGSVLATNKATGEVVELPVANLEELMAAWEVASQYDKLATELKNKLKKLVPKYVNDLGQSETLDNRQFKVISVQRMNYDQAKLRELLDEDTYETLLKPNKTLVDNYIKENLETLGTISTELRQSMVEDGKPYQMIKLEKLS